MQKRNPNPALLEAKRKARVFKRRAHAMQQDSLVKDVFQKAMKAKTLVRGRTALVYDESCLRDYQHPECSERSTGFLARCSQLNLLQRCSPISARKATKDEILLVHSEEHYNLLQSTMNSGPDQSTFELALLAAGSAIDLVAQVMTRKVQNGMAVLYPHGYNATEAGCSDQCVFNNVAIAAQNALNSLKLEKILIVDLESRGTQRCYYGDPRVLYFSINRFENATTPDEPDFNGIGEWTNLGYKFNVPLNGTRIGNGDYLAVCQQLLIPVATEYQPQLIIVSALGYPTGGMEITPEMYAHLLHPLLGLAESRVVVIIEDRHHLESYAEGAAITLRTLLGEAAPTIVAPQSPCVTTQRIILHCAAGHHVYWHSLRARATFIMEALKECTHNVPKYQELSAHRLKFLKAPTKLLSPPVRLCFVYDDLMMQHFNLSEKRHPEQPERIKKIFERHHEYALIERMRQRPTRIATMDEICLVHTQTHVDFIRAISEKHDLQDIAAKYDSVYFHPKTFDCAAMAVGSVLQVVDQVLTGEARSGVCIVRPPGHHAEADQPQGFCIFNNVAIAAQYALEHHYLQRVLIVDWDVHHGNGTQHIFEANPKVLYISIHRYDRGTFYPTSEDGNYNVVGKEAGVGFNVNIPWNKKHMGDTEYAMAFQQLIMPIAHEFDPELVLISAGFDAAVGDPLGGCRVTPEAYGLFTHWLSALANGRVIICLEGGYNLRSISYCMTMCTKSLLGDPIMPVDLTKMPSAPYLSCLETLHDCLAVQQQHWKSLRFIKGLSDSDVDFTTAEMKYKECRCSRAAVRPMILWTTDAIQQHIMTLRSHICSQAQ